METLFRRKMISEWKIQQIQQMIKKGEELLQDGLFLDAEKTFKEIEIKCSRIEYAKVTIYKAICMLFNSKYAKRKEDILIKINEYYRKNFLGQKTLPVYFFEKIIEKLITDDLRRHDKWLIIWLWRFHITHPEKMKYNYRWILSKLIANSSIVQLICLESQVYRKTDIILELTLGDNPTEQDISKCLKNLKKANFKHKSDYFSVKYKMSKQLIKKNPSKVNLDGHINAIISSFRFSNLNRHQNKEVCDCCQMTEPTEPETKSSKLKEALIIILQHFPNPKEEWKKRVFCPYFIECCNMPDLRNEIKLLSQIIEDVINHISNLEQFISQCLQVIKVLSPSKKLNLLLKILKKTRKEDEKIQVLEDLIEVESQLKLYSEVILHHKEYQDLNPAIPLPIIAIVSFAATMVNERTLAFKCICKAEQSNGKYYDYKDLVDFSLGLLYRRNHQMVRAKDHFKKSLKCLKTLEKMVLLCECYYELKQTDKVQRQMIEVILELLEDYKSTDQIISALHLLFKEENITPKIVKIVLDNILPTIKVQMTTNQDFATKIPKDFEMHFLSFRNSYNIVQFFNGIH